MERIKINLISYLISLVLTTIGMPFIINMFKDSNCTSLNYKKEEIPIGLGLIFILVQAITLSFLIIIKEYNNTYIMIYLVAFILMGLVGMFDDLTGDTNVKGFRGHIKALLEGKLTTGGLKAITGFGVSFLVSLLISKGIVELIVNTLLIALFTNFINLFDLRPGRAAKVFIILSIILLWTNNTSNELNLILFSFYGILTRYLPIDLKAKAMMGDAGSNSLGLTLGIYCALTHSFSMKLIYLSILIILQLISEFISFSKVIEKNKILRFIDNIGR